MRLWHKDLIDVLPRQQLLGQWRECCLIARNIREKGTPNHILVNRVMDYPIEHLYEYQLRIVMEMKRRGYKVDATRFSVALCGDDYARSPGRNYVPVKNEELFAGWHNIRYLTQCYANLEEKYDCGGISEQEWRPVASKYFDLMF